MTRDLNQESQNTQDHSYAYDFDWIIRKYLLKRVNSHFTAHDKALELGCFQGDMTEQILGYFNDLTVVEGSSELAAKVGQRFSNRSIKVIHSTFQEARLDAQYDIIFLVNTLEHLDDRVAMLKKISQWLTPKGKLIVAVPNANALSRQIAVQMQLIAYNAAITPAEYEHGHRITYSMDRLQDELQQAGLTIIDQAGILVKPLANFQFDQALAAGIINEQYLEGCYRLGSLYPDLCATLVAVCSKPAAGSA